MARRRQQDRGKSEATVPKALSLSSFSFVSVFGVALPRRKRTNKEKEY
jgi:hypothetical protein